MKAFGLRADTGPPSQWVQSPRWDGFWFFSGAWAPALAILIYFAVRLASDPSMTLDPAGFDPSRIALIYVPLSILHRISTTYSVLGTSILKEDREKHPIRYHYVPAGIVVGCILLSCAFTFHSAFDFMPSVHAQLWGFFLLAYVMMIWELWHFCAQEFGVLSIYRIRAGQRASEDKRFDRRFTIILMMGTNVVLYICWGFANYIDVLFYGLPDWKFGSELREQIALLALLAGVIVTAWACVREWRHPQRSIPKIAFYLLVGGHTVLLYAFPRAFGLFFLSYVFHHWMVSVGLFGRTTLNAFKADTRDTRAALKRLGVSIAQILIVFVPWYLFFGSLDTSGNLTPVPNAQSFEGMPPAVKVYSGVIIASFFALSFLHFYYDRCFYAFSRPAVRKDVFPLVFGPAPKPKPGDTKIA
jgi:hypothetical protein